MDKKKVLVADPISEKGIADLQSCPSLDVVVKIGIKPEELLATAHEYDGIVVPTLGLEQTVVTPFGGVHGISLFAQRLREVAEQARLVFDDKESHGRLEFMVAASV